MQTSISEWLESNTGESRRQMALRIGQTPSTFNRNIDMPDVIIAVCRAYRLNPVDALVLAGYINNEDVTSYANSIGFQGDTDDMYAGEILDRISEYSDELRKRLKDRPRVVGQWALKESVTSRESVEDDDPDYSQMSDEDAKDYGLAAFKGEDNIAHDDLPHEP